MPSNGKKFFILSIDGGGIRGLIPLYALEYVHSVIDRQLPNTPIHQHFDLIAGTSTGGIIAAALCCPRRGFENTPAFSPTALIDLYVNQGAQIFNSPRSLSE